ncbi:hypothetical protein ABEG18_02160 [Alsobacter sp. KACC 23698]|uniref:Uncharacterized protein n=1 Tax=Alsobacter sp. KACC 23698 TaxID=3149229 RepID=A0AAU7JHD3_9HYPH
MRVALAVPGSAAALGAVIVVLAAIVGSLFLLRITPASGLAAAPACQVVDTIGMGAECWYPE